MMGNCVNIVGKIKVSTWKDAISKFGRGEVLPGTHILRRCQCVLFARVSDQRDVQWLSSWVVSFCDLKISPK